MNNCEKKAKRKLVWWKKIIVIVAILLAVIVAFSVFSFVMIRHFTGDSLSFKGTLSMLGYSGLNLPKGISKYILDVDRSYDGLPELLTANDGSAVSSTEEYSSRRNEILEKVETYLYGKTPNEGFETAFELVESGEALDGKAIREQVRITVSTEKGSHEVMLLIYRPKDKTNVPMFVGENFNGNTTIASDDNILPSYSQNGEIKYGENFDFVNLLIENGCGVATTSYTDWAPDTEEDYRNGVLKLFPQNNETAFSAWSFGIMRTIDYLYSQSYVNKEAVVSYGHSRLARVSLWAGAQDERITLVTSSCGGGLFRSDIAGKITTTSNSNHWFTEKYFSFEGNDNALPVDMHMLMALTADRHLYISMGASDLAADPVGTFDALQKAKVVWELYGVKVIPDMDYYDLKEDVPVFSDGIATHVHKGAHALTNKDFAFYIEYLNEYVLGK